MSDDVKWVQRGDRGQRRDSGWRQTGEKGTRRHMGRSAHARRFKAGSGNGLMLGKECASICRKFPAG
jgi:hypothetical protein